MNRLPNAIAILLLTATTAQADTNAKTCEFIEGSAENCIRFVGCINKDIQIAGTSRGFDGGTMYGTTSEGNTCTGTWQTADQKVGGTGTIECSNGETTEIRFFVRGTEYFAGSSAAITSHGRRMTVWASVDLEGFFKEKFPDGEHPGYECSGIWWPMPAEFPMKPE